MSRGLRQIVVAAAILACLAACTPQRVAGPAQPAQAAPLVPDPTLAQPAPLPPAGSVPPGEAAPLVPPLAPTTQPAPVVVGGQIKVGLLVPLSGRAAAAGKAIQEAAELAVFDFGGDGFTLIPVDTEAAGAAAAATQALDQGAQLILGPLFGAQIPEVAAVARPRGVNLVSFSSDKSAAGPGAYILGLPPSQAVERVIAHARSQGVQRFAALLPSDQLGSRIAETVSQAVPAAGGTVYRIDTYDPSVTDFAPAVRRVAEFDRRRVSPAPASTEGGRTADQRRRAARMTTGSDVDYDALIMAESGLRLRLLAPQLPYYDIDPKVVRFIGTPLWEDMNLGLEPALSGAWFAAPDPAGRVDFEKKYKDTYGRTAPRIATLGYDGVGMAAILARTTGGPNFGEANLTNPSGFIGVDGLFRLLPDGGIQRGLAVIEIHRGEFKVVSPPPTTFEPQVN